MPAIAEAKGFFVMSVVLERLHDWQIAGVDCFDKSASASWFAAVEIDNWAQCFVELFNGHME